jgi:cold shock CspA family protein
MPVGRLKLWNAERQFGFFETSFGDVYVSHREMRVATNTPHVNEWYSFQLQKDSSDKRPRAVKVRKLADSEVEEEAKWERLPPIKFGQEMPGKTGS